MLHKVKMEPANYGISVGDLDSLDQVVVHLEKVMNVGFFRVRVVAFPIIS